MTAHLIPMPARGPVAAPPLDEIAATTRPVFHVELRGPGHVIRGIVSPVKGEDMPRSVRLDGHTYVATGDVIGGGSMPTYHVFTSDIIAAFRLEA